MKLSDINTIKEILEKHGFSFSKALGQNFLINPSVCPKMAVVSGADENTGVLEIGPGIGVLTYELAKVSKRVVAVELDKRLPEVLNETLAEFDNVKIINDDILKIDVRELIEKEFSDCGKVCVCANLPYYITSPIIMSLLEAKLPIDSITVMVQKEAADRICADVGTRACGAVTAAVHYYCEPKLEFKVSRGSFMPVPNVDSAVISLKIKNDGNKYTNNEKLFFTIIKAAFSQRRKMMAKLIASQLNLSKDTILAAMRNSGIADNARAEQVTLKQFGDLSNEIDSIIDKK